MISHNASRKVVRTVAIFEAAKGLLVLAAGFGLLTLLHRDARVVAQEFVGRLHLNPSRRFAGIFIEAASHVTDKHLWFYASLAFIYAAFRLLEAYGLWRERAWAEWLALISGAVYLPIEIYELIVRVTWVRVTVLTLNVAIVIFMAQVLLRSLEAKRLEQVNATADSSKREPPPTA